MESHAVFTSNVPPQTVVTTAFGYDAINPKGKRQAPTGLLRSEDAELRAEQRRQLTSYSRDVNRNFAIAGWMVRKHLDYVSRFTFESRIGDKAKDKAVEDWFKGWSKAENCDIAGRHSFNRMVRIAEGRRVGDGDIGVVRISSGKLQWLESDRIRTPNFGGNQTTAQLTGPLDDVVHGVRVNKAGKATEYAVNSRGKASDFVPGTSGNFIFEKWVSANNLYLHGCFDRIDQIRGISPMTAALNNLRDVYEGTDYALAKMKIAQLWAGVFFRQSFDSIAPTTGTADGVTDGTGYEVDFGQGPVMLDLDPGDDLKFLESATPSTEFQSFCGVVIAMCLKSLDIPYSFYAENFTNYSGARQALLQYEESCDAKRADIIEMLDWIISWRLSIAVIDGEIPGVTLDELAWEWIPSGIPWIDPLKEAEADAISVDRGFESTPGIVKKRTGKDAYDVADDEAKYRDYRKSIGLPDYSAMTAKVEDPGEQPAAAASANGSTKNRLAL